MDLTRTGKIYDLERYKSPIKRNTSTQSGPSQGKSSLMEKSASNGDVLETRSRFEQVFLESPRAQVMWDWCKQFHNGNALDLSGNLIYVR